jgi:hypothetical protein
MSVRWSWLKVEHHGASFCARHRRPLAGLAALLAGGMFALPPAVARNFVPRERTLRRTTDAGTELRVYGYTRMETGCRPGEPPRIVLLHPPAHGTVATRPGPSTIREVREGTSAACVGMTVPGIHVWYTPAPGYHGTDRFDWNVISRGGTFHDTAVVEVR